MNVHGFEEVDCSDVDGYPLISFIHVEKINLGLPSRVCCTWMPLLFFPFWEGEISVFIMYI